MTQKFEEIIVKSKSNKINKISMTKETKPDFLGNEWSEEDIVSATEVALFLLDIHNRANYSDQRDRNDMDDLRIELGPTDRKSSVNCVYFLGPVLCLDSQDVAEIYLLVNQPSISSIWKTIFIKYVLLILIRFFVLNSSLISMYCF